MHPALAAPEIGSPPLVRHAPPELVIAQAPVAGANFTQAVNDGYWWRLLAITCRLDTSAAAANRTVRLELRGGDGIPFIVSGNPVTYPANTAAEDFYFNVWQPQGAWEVGVANLVPLAAVLLQPGQDFRLTVVNIQAADTLTRIRYLVERFEAPGGDFYPSS